MVTVSGKRTFWPPCRQVVRTVLIAGGLGQVVLWVAAWADVPVLLVTTMLIGGCLTAVAALLQTRGITVIALVTQLGSSGTLMVYQSVAVYQANPEFGPVALILGFIIGLISSLPALGNSLLLLFYQYSLRYRNWYTDT